jgi:hypothetical protein
MASFKAATSPREHRIDRRLKKYQNMKRGPRSATMSQAVVIADERGSTTWLGG